MSGTDSGIVRAALAEAAKFLARGDLVSAEQAASAALNASVQRDGEALHMMGQVRFRQHRLDEAAMLLARALQAGYRTPDCCCISAVPCPCWGSMPMPPPSCRMRSPAGPR